jgi:hypothetical protein
VPKPDVPNANDQPAFPLIQNALYFNGLKQTLGPSSLRRSTSDLAARLEHAVPVIAGIYALTQKRHCPMNRRDLMNHR